MATLSQERPTDAIAALLQERQRYEQWLAALESRRATTSSHVYARVHEDYESRLARVLDELGGRSAELRQVVDTLTDRVTTLQTEENGHRDVRAEAELRAAVGEYSPEQWREVSQTSEADIARIAARRAEAASELAQVQQLLNMATASPRRPDASASGHSTVAATAPAPTATGADASHQDAGRPAPRQSGAAVGASTAGGAGAAAAAPGGPPTSFDELAFLNSVVEPTGEPEPDAPPANAAPNRPSAAVPAAPARAKTPAVPVAAVSGSSAPARPAVTPADSAAVPGPAPVDKTAEKPGESARRAPSLTDPVPLFLRDVPVEQIKTLKCAECGNMNYPTEWYCERCGGELAAM
jgi:Skp family chaperone for outer membrane proteins